MKSLLARKYNTIFVQIGRKRILGRSPSGKWIYRASSIEVRIAASDDKVDGN